MISLIFVLLFSASLLQAQFDTLDSLQEYAQHNPEIVEPSNTDWLNPDFSSFYAQNKPSWWQRLFSKQSNSKTWNSDEFKKLLQKLLSEHADKIDSKYLAERIEPSEGDSFIIWGDLSGAFHSLVRDLTYLNQQGIIREDLIIKKNYYFVFNGNVIEGSPYSLETLTIVLQLMVKNPGQVIYTRGYSEAHERWHNFEMARQLKAWRTSRTNGGIPFNRLLNRFFNTLPIALFITKQTGDSIDAVAITGTEEAGKKFKNNELGDLFTIKKKQGFFSLNKQIYDSQKQITIRALIGSEDRLISYNKTSGLILAEGVGQAETSWFIFSSPTEKNQKLYKFHYDAFVKLNITGEINEWSLSLINKVFDARESFSVAETFLVTSGKRVDVTQQADAQDLFFGATMDLSKSASSIGKKVREGLQLSFQNVNKLKNLPGISPQIRIVDDEYTPFNTRAAVEAFLKSGIDIMIGSQGSPSLESYLDLVKEGKILVLFPFTGASIFRKPDLKNIIHYRPSYIQEGQELIRFALKNLKSKRFVVFYQDDSFGLSALEGAIRAFKAAGITDYLAIPHERNATNFNHQIKQIKDFNPDTILFASVSLAIRALIRQIGVQYFAGKKLLGLSVYEDAFERFLKDKGLQLTIVRVVPDPATSDLEIAKEYRALADKNNLSYDKIAFEDFINANILFEILSHIQGPVSKEKIIEVAENFKDHPFKGLVLNFNPETRSISDMLWIDTGQGPWIVHKASLGKKDDVIIRKDGNWQLGSIVDLSGGTKDLGRGVKNGLELRLELAQSMGLSNLPQLTIKDDGYEPERSRKEAENFIKQGITTFICPTGSPTLESYLDLVKIGDIGVLFPVTGAPISRNETLTNLINLRASYPDEARVISSYAIENLKAQKIVAFYQDDAFGKGLMDAGRAVLENKKASFIELSYQRHQKDFSRQAKELLEYNPDTILCFSTALATQDFMRQIGIEKSVTLHILGNSDLGETDFINFARDVGLKLIYVNVVPNPQTSQLQIVKEYREFANKQKSILDNFALEGFIAMDLLLHVTQPMGKDISRDAIIKQLMSYKNQEYKGLTLSFDPKTRSLLNVLWLYEGNPEWKMISVIKQ